MGKKENPQIEIMEYLALLGKESQQKVLDFIKTFAKSPKKKKKQKDILKYANAFSKKDVEQMEKAINEGCEKIDTDGW